MARPGDQSIPVTPRTPKLKLLGTLDKDFAEPETPPLVRAPNWILLSRLQPARMC